VFCVKRCQNGCPSPFNQHYLLQTTVTEYCTIQQINLASITDELFREQVQETLVTIKTEFPIISWQSQTRILPQFSIFDKNTML